MSDRNLFDLDPVLRDKAQRFVQECNTDALFISFNARVFIDETYRCEADQNADYAQSRTMPGRVITNAQYGQSPHNCVDENGKPAARAFDFAIQLIGSKMDWDASDPLWRRAIAIGSALGLLSGSRWHNPIDAPHFELPGWQSA